MFDGLNWFAFSNSALLYVIATFTGSTILKAKVKFVVGILIHTVSTNHYIFRQYHCGNINEICQTTNFKEIITRKMIWIHIH